MFVDVNGVTLFYESSGNGVPLILLHGNGEEHHIFDALVKKLSNDFQVYAIDSRNHGKSQKTDHYSYKTMAEDVYGFIQTLDLGAVNLVGFSDGAIISLMLAMKHQNVLRKMVLLGVNLNPEDFTDESYQYVKDTYEETGDPLFKLMLEQPNISLEDVRNISVPTFLIAGENDIYRPGTFTKLQDAMPNAKLKIMQGHDHSSYVIGEDLLYGDLIPFFDSSL